MSQFRPLPVRSVSPSSNYYFATMFSVLTVFCLLNFWAGKEHRSSASPAMLQQLQGEKYPSAVGIYDRNAFWAVKHFLMALVFWSAWERGSGSRCVAVRNTEKDATRLIRGLRSNIRTMLGNGCDLSLITKQPFKWDNVLAVRIRVWNCTDTVFGIQKCTFQMSLCCCSSALPVRLSLSASRLCMSTVKKRRCGCTSTPEARCSRKSCESDSCLCLFPVA